MRGSRAVPARLALVVLLTILGFWIEPIIKGPNFAVLYMLAVVVTALRLGRRAAIISAISSALLYDFFFVTRISEFRIQRHFVPALAYWYVGRRRTGEHADAGHEGGGSGIFGAVLSHKVAGD